MLHKPVTARSEDYKAWVRGLICLCCHRPSPEPHHEPRASDNGMGMKVSDFRCIPLCALHHRLRHDRGKETFAREWNLDYEAVIARLNAIYNNWKGETP